MKEIPICGDGWLAVFDFVAPRQLGLEIALLSRRFDYFVDEHFKMRTWILGTIRIQCKNERNQTTEMQIVNSDAKLVPIPHKPMPNKVVGFKSICITNFDQNVANFLQNFRPLFSSCAGINLIIRTVSEFVVQNIWSLISSNICGLEFYSNYERMHRHLAVALFIGDKCPPSLRTVNTVGVGFFPTFPADDSATATNGQALAKWLFTPRPDGLPKVLRLHYVMNISDQWASKIDALKVAFANASSGANFIIYIIFPWSSNHDLVVPFILINQLTGERLTLTRQLFNQFLLVRSPFGRDEQKWAKYEKEATDWQLYNKWNRILIEL